MLMNMKDLLAVANEHNFAVPAFNIGTNEMLNGVIEACEETGAPVILAFQPAALKFQGDAFMLSCLGAARACTIPVAVHLDHGRTMEDIMRGVRTGVTSVMIDASHLPFEDNVAITKRVVDLVRPLGISVEGELGTIGTTEGDTEGGAEEIVLTRPGDAAEFVARTGIDALAVAIGTAHGLYPAGFIPKLNHALLSEIKAKVEVPLVLHGGSANGAEEIGECVERGINKINISSDIKDAFYRQLRRTLAADTKVREPFLLYLDSVAAMKKVVFEKIRLLRAENKAGLY